MVYTFYELLLLILTYFSHLSQHLFHRCRRDSLLLLQWLSLWDGYYILFIYSFFFSCECVEAKLVKGKTSPIPTNGTIGIILPFHSTLLILLWCVRAFLINMNESISQQL